MIPTTLSHKSINFSRWSHFLSCKRFRWHLRNTTTDWPSPKLQGEVSVSSPTVTSSFGAESPSSCRPPGDRLIYSEDVFSPGNRWGCGRVRMGCLCLVVNCGTSSGASFNEVEVCFMKFPYTQTRLHTLLFSTEVQSLMGHIKGKCWLGWC